MKLLSPTLLAIAVACFALPAAAQSAGDWTLAIGAGHVNPKSDNGSLADGTLDVDIGSSTRPTIAFEYFIRDGLGIEVLAATPFSHGIDIDGMGKVGSTKHLPPTVSLQYHFNRDGKVRPLLGLGVNYTTFFSEGTTGALAGSDLSLGDSWGVAAHAGLDFDVGERGAFRVDVRWMDIDSDVKLDGAKLGTANIDPLVFGASYVIRF